MGLKTVDFQSPLIVTGLPFWKGRIRATEDGKVRGPQCCDALSTLNGLQEWGNPIIFGIGLVCCTNGWVACPCLDRSIHSASILGIPSPLLTPIAHFHHDRQCFPNGTEPPSTVPSWEIFELLLSHPWHCQILSTHPSSSIVGPWMASPPVPGAVPRQLTYTLFRPSTSCSQPASFIRTIPTHGKLGSHRHPG